MHLHPATYVVALLAALAGGTVQGSVGFGLNLLVAPIVAFIEPEAIPGALLVMALPMTALIMLREHEHIEWRGVGWVTLGRLPGVAVGAWVVTVVSAATLSALTGGAVILATLLSSRMPEVHVSAGSELTAGFASGAMGTASSIGGPPVALLYQHWKGPALRSTLAVMYLIGAVMSVAGLALAGAMEGWQIAFGLALVPGGVTGVWLSGHVNRWLDARWLRPAVLAVAVVAGLAAIGRAVAG